MYGLHLTFHKYSEVCLLKWVGMLQLMHVLYGFMTVLPKRTHNIMIFTMRECCIVTMHESIPNFPHL